MPGYRRVDAQLAGQAALGILVPPGLKTVVILRPRGLEWDLLPARWQGDAGSAPVFCQYDRDEAAQVARHFQRALEEQAALGRNPLETFGSPNLDEFQIWVRAGDFVWIVCRRSAGEHYRPAVFASLEEADQAGRRLTPYFHPGPDEVQEYYFNTQAFEKGDGREKGDRSRETGVRS